MVSCDDWFCLGVAEQACFDADIFKKRIRKPRELVCRRASRQIACHGCCRAMDVGFKRFKDTMAWEDGCEVRHGITGCFKACLILFG